MPISITLKGTLVAEVVDVEYLAALEAFNLASAAGKTFISMEDMNGSRVMISIPDIVAAHEIDDVTGPSDPSDFIAELTS